MAYDSSALEDIMRLSGERLQQLAAVRAELREQEGTASSESGLAAATVGADGRLRGLELDPRLLRAGTHQIAEEVVAAVNRAIDDLQAHIAEAMEPITQGRPVTDVLSADGALVDDMRRFGDGLREHFDRVAAEVARMRGA
jgi:DNA-binding protein YbaB